MIAACTTKWDGITVEYSTFASSVRGMWPEGRTIGWSAWTFTGGMTTSTPMIRRWVRKAPNGTWFS